MLVAEGTAHLLAKGLKLLILEVEAGRVGKQCEETDSGHKIVREALGTVAQADRLVTVVGQGLVFPADCGVGLDQIMAIACGQEQDQEYCGNLQH